MGFKSIAKRPRVADNPVDFFHDLRPRKIAALYDQQAKVLRDYAADALEDADVAIQGATGSGKTVVGLIIAEWRRRRFAERPLYLCPTRQLVHQVSAFARDQLGLNAFPFTGKKSMFPPDQAAGWKSGDVVGIATYSALFNTSPFFTEPNFIVMDDAHTAEQYIAEFWTVRLSKRDGEHRPLFDATVALLQGVLSPDDHIRLREDPRGLSDHLWVQMVPGPGLYEIQGDLSAVLDQAPENTDLDYRWRMLKGMLAACQMFVSPYEIVIRPIIPPTGTHEPFCAARQRVYMSATLGRGGELERLSGRKQIKRLPSPPGWDGHGVGRRFFIFPNASLTEEETGNFVERLISDVSPGRALLLTPDDRSAAQASERVNTNLPGYTVYSAADIERSKAPFVEDEKAVAVISNRYDGIDFPDDECRLLIIDDRPAGMNLLERYLSEKLTARALFAERTRTRVVQAFGRCTRSARDYAVVCIIGQKLMDELLLSERKRALDSDLQAELIFGEEQSKDVKSDELLSFVRLFLEQGDDWRAAEDQIFAIREELDEILPEALQELGEAAKHEVDYVHCLWRGDYAGALDAAQSTITALAGGDALKGYRGMWHYLAGCAALLLSSETGGDADKALHHFKTARKVCAIRLPNIEALGQEQADETPFVFSDQLAVERLELNLCELGLTNPAKFARLEQDIRRGLESDDAKSFERAQQQLGDLLGFRSENSEEQGAPDPRWSIGDSLCFVFEDHIKESSDTDISLEKARQAAGHVKWVRANMPALAEKAAVISILVTNARTDSEDCRIHLNDVSVWPLQKYRKWASSVLDSIRALRAGLSRQGDLAWRAEAISELARLSATPSSLAEAMQELQKRTPRRR